MMKIKICGLKYEDNIRDISVLQPDMIGFIFYPGSERFAGDMLQTQVLSGLSPAILKVGVFVSQDRNEVLDIAGEYGLDIVQLHGNESCGYCGYIRDNGYKIIKAIPVNDKPDKDLLLSYAGIADYFLFDTAATGYGGSGRTFDWNILKDYDVDTPFLLSGGLGNDNIKKALRFNHPRFAGVDANSRLESRPGLKDPGQALTFINTIRNATI